MADGSRALADLHARRDAKSGAAAGLVTSETSQNRAGFRIKGVITPAMQRKARLLRTRKTVITGARLAVEEAQRGGFRGRWAMLTLTYREDVRWVAKQLAALTDHIRKYAVRCDFVARYVWALELTARGRPHYHLLVWLPKGRTLPKPDKQGWWPHGMTKIEWARNAVGYLAKYASKGIEEGMWCCIPKGARMCGNGGLSLEARTELRWWKLPTWVREVFTEISDVRRCQGGFVNRGRPGQPSGEFLASPYRVMFFGGALVLMEIEA